MSDWLEKASCRGQDVGGWFPERSGNQEVIVHRARFICSRCPVRNECFEYAVSLVPLVSGIWAGTTTKERAAIKAGKATKPEWLAA